MLSEKFCARCLTLLLCLFFTSLSAEEPCPYWDPEQVERRAKKPSYLPPAQKRAPDPLPSLQTRLFVDGEILYWKPDQMGMTYCLLEEAETFTFLFAPNNQARQQEADWGLGFRIGLGIDIEAAHMDIAGYWTRFHHTMHSITQTDQFIFGTQLFFGGGFVLGGGALQGMTGTPGGPANSQWDLHLDLAEIDFGYWFCCGKWVSLRPYLGVEAGWINQKQIIHYDQFLDTNTNLFFDAVISHKNDFKGIGPVLGLDGTFSMGYGLSLMGKAATSFLYGSSNNPVRLQVTSSSSPPPFLNTSILCAQYRLMPVFASQIGFGWERRWTERLGLFLNAAYEVQYFWETWRNQSSFIQCVAVFDAGYSDLMIHGLTGQIRMSF